MKQLGIVEIFRSNNKGVRGQMKWRLTKSFHELYDMVDRYGGNRATERNGRNGSI